MPYNDGMNEKQLIEKQIEWNQQQQGMWQDIGCDEEAAFYEKEAERLQSLLK